MPKTALTNEFEGGAAHPPEYIDRLVPALNADLNCGLELDGIQVSYKDRHGKSNLMISPGLQHPEKSA